MLLELSLYYILYEILRDVIGGRPTVAQLALTLKTSEFLIHYDY